MREIRFRGKRFDNGEWVYGDLVRVPRDAGSWSEPPSQELTWHITDSRKLTHEWIEVDPETVGQYTELPDKNGKEIYEGDIIKTVRDRYTQHWLVEEIGAMERDNSHYGLCVSPDGNGVNYWIDNSILSGEVVGNIHENPELVEENEE